MNKVFNPLEDLLDEQVKAIIYKVVLVIIYTYACFYILVSMSSIFDIFTKTAITFNSFVLALYYVIIIVCCAIGIVRSSLLMLCISAMCIHVLL